MGWDEGVFLAISLLKEAFKWKLRLLTIPAIILLVFRGQGGVPELLSTSLEGSDRSLT